ncbi:hypothetical protein ACJJIU_05415 [Microbulbifer sp. CnH-101-E]|uniref:hypothetical protein n=1 Tax=unclassified Microbulbifer TaxID=2619833 RepID=UPI004039F822
MKKNPPKGSGRVRNYIARNPLMGKGGAHVKAKSGKRFLNKQKIRKEVREWRGSRDTYSLVVAVRFILPLTLAGF